MLTNPVLVVVVFFFGQSGDVGFFCVILDKLILTNTALTSKSHLRIRNCPGNYGLDEVFFWSHFLHPHKWQKTVFGKDPFFPGLSGTSRRGDPVPTSPSVLPPHRPQRNPVSRRPRRRRHHPPPGCVGRSGDHPALFGVRRHVVGAPIFPRSLRPRGGGWHSQPAASKKLREVCAGMRSVRRPGMADGKALAPPPAPPTLPALTGPAAPPAVQMGHPRLPDPSRVACRVATADLGFWVPALSVSM